MYYSALKHCDIANGEGVRTSLFVSGCRRHCKNCFNPETWDFKAGELYTQQVEDEILESLKPHYVDGLTLLGGEPMEPENQRELVALVERVKREFPDKTIWCFTGDRLEDIQQGSKHTEVSDRLLNCIDVLVDGPFIDELKDITLRFCGSSNQRIIDVQRSLGQGSVVLWKDDPVFATHSME